MGNNSMTNSPYTALMFRTFSSKVNLDIMNAIYKCEVLRFNDFKSMLELEPVTIFNHTAELMRSGLIEKAVSMRNGIKVKCGYKFTAKGKKIYDNLKDFYLGVEQDASIY